MQGRFVLDGQMLKHFEGNIEKATNYMIALMTGEKNHLLTWFARRKHPVSGEMEYLWDSFLPRYVVTDEDARHLLFYQKDGYELNYDMFPRGILTA